MFGSDSEPEDGEEGLEALLNVLWINLNRLKLHATSHACQERTPTSSKVLTKRVALITRESLSYKIDALRSFCDKISRVLAANAVLVSHDQPEEVPRGLKGVFDVAVFLEDHVMEEYGGIEP